ncbi:MAG TPA: hypothetical protein VKZ60_19720 [Chloroflexota bacterium]|jgi:hypothetical protein|nr:hypothetical protein [Chloroflexota bacterium]
MRRSIVALALGAVLALGAGVPAVSAQYLPYGGYPYYGYPGLGYSYWAPYGGYALPYGGYGAVWPYAAPILSGAYNATGAPTFGVFPYLALAGNFATAAPFGYYQPYAFFLGCSPTYTASNYYVCR